MIRPQLSLDLNGELIVDNFAGGGGASTGIELALGRCVDLAINHDPEALAMHEINHPQTKHLPENIWAVDPVAVTHGRPVGLLWLSPDCKHFSKAKGGKPREKKIRGLALIGLNWVRLKRPRVMILENVEEFQTWGPLLADGTLNPRAKGQTFRAYVGWLQRRGYQVEWRELRACDYGAPTIRKRLFLIARCDGVPITWPEPTHGAPTSEGVKARKLSPWRTAAECIDWAIACPSIFERKRELANATCRRIAKGIMRYVVNCASPFIVRVDQTSGDAARKGIHPLTEPTRTIASAGGLALVTPTLMVNTTGHTGGKVTEPLKTVATGPHHFLVAPVLTEHANQKHERVFAADEPLRTQCAQVKGGHFALIAPILAETAHGEVAPGGSKRWGSGARTTEKPLNTLAASNNAALVTAFLAKHYGGHETPGWPLEKPISTVTAQDHHGLVAAHITKFRTGSTGSDMAEPMHTITAGPKENPAGAPHAMGMIAAHLSKLRGTSTAQAADEPLHTVSSQGTHFAEVRAFLIKYYGSDQDPRLEEPMHTATTKDRFGLVTVNGEEYAIADIGLRMLAPAELFRAQGFPGSYIIDRGMFELLIDGKPTGRREIRPLTKSAQVRMCGNSVCPPLAEALVRANVPELSAWDKSERKRRTA